MDRPGSATAQQAFFQAVQMQQAGRLAEAEQLFRRVLAFDPRHADSLHLLGVVYLQADRHREAADMISKAIAVDARSPQFHNNLGSVLRAMGRLPQAEASFRKAVALRPDYPRALVNLGQVTSQSRPAEAMEWLRRAIALAPNDLEALWTLGVLAHQQGGLDEAEACYRRGLQLAPQSVELHENLAGVLFAKGRGADGVAALQRALQIDPSSAQRWSVLAGAFEGLGRISEAVDAYRQAIQRQPDLALAHNGLGNALANLGRLDESVAAYREAIRLQPDYLECRSNLIMTLHSAAEVSAADILAEAKAYAAQVEPRPAPSFRNSSDPGRRLRVGYVSADFRVHPVGFFLDRVLPAHDPAQVETVLYSDVAFPDEQTERLRTAAGAWRSIAGRPDAEVLKTIRDDRIDILIDLAGHTGTNRLGVFGARAAPVQASWLGYFGTTGLASMDYVIADEVVLPPGDEADFSETLVRIDAPYLCWSPPQAPVASAPFPALARGHVTFGCFNNRAKVNRQTIAAWARILSRVEGSTLFLKSWSLGDAGCRAGLVEAFAEQGIAAERIELEGMSPRVEALAAYNRVDIALDPFPFGGCTTTADTLWMGVPLVALAGERWSGRMSRTILESLGLGHWVANNLEAYVETAVSMAGDLSGLTDVREGLRAKLEASAFCDGPAFTRRLEAAYRDLWRARCEAARA